MFKDQAAFNNYLINELMI